MLVSLKWLAHYIDLPMGHQELTQRLSLSGLNHESTDEIDGQIVIDLEVTSNRGDCLGHLGVAREIGVLYGLETRFPEPAIQEAGPPIADLLKVDNRFVEACPRYSARVIQGVKVGPSPDWLVEALQSVFWKRKLDGSIERYQSINNVVDATNYVLMECGQPLHAFDYQKLNNREIVVRPAGDGETMQAIDHKEYLLDPAMCVIADATDPSAIAGVMGGAKSEVSESTTDLVIESAVFTPLSIRRTARKLKLHSPSSYRFERKVDPVGVEWASRRVCEMIVELAGGTIASGMIDTAPNLASSPPVILRVSQLERILGIQLSQQEITRILESLGCQSGESNDGATAFTPPSWRHDLTREADLIEEVARIHGYDKIPDDSPIPVAPSAKRPFDTALSRVRQVLTASGISEAMTPSVVTEKIDQTVSPWTDKPSLKTKVAMLKGAKTLRRSMIPSLLEGRAKNWASASLHADLFEIAHLYLPSDSDDALPTEQYSLAMITGQDYFCLKGILETLCARLGSQLALDVSPVDRAGFAKRGCVELLLADEVVGYLGIIDKKVLKSWKLNEPVCAAELSLDALLQHTTLVPQQKAVSMFPSVQRDLNFVVGEQVAWREMERVVRSSVGESLASVTYRETYRDAQKDGSDRKRVLLTVELQRHDETLSGEQADSLVGELIQACQKELAAELLS
ncbi:phenylalanine--tRNA ligase subunit beta [Rubripirellula sp.]|nr:phenylalanine--tRNA ligase subunit beta [Rubripirellula sp.]